MDRRTFSNVFPVIMFGLMGLVVVAVVGVIAGSWVWFGIALAVYAVATVIVIGGLMKGPASGSAADDSSRRLRSAARDATGKANPTMEDELEALKHRPPDDPIRQR